MHRITIHSAATIPWAIPPFGHIFAGSNPLTADLGR
jgi:hypothetical protein